MIVRIDSNDSTQSGLNGSVNFGLKPPPTPPATATPSTTPTATATPSTTPTASGTGVSHNASTQPSDNVFLRYSVAAIGALPALKTTRSLVTLAAKGIGASLLLRGENGALNADASRAAAALQRDAANGLNAFSRDFTTAAKGPGATDLRSLLRDVTSRDSSFQSDVKLFNQGVTRANDWPIVRQIKNVFSPNTIPEAQNAAKRLTTNLSSNADDLAAQATATAARAQRYAKIGDGIDNVMNVLGTSPSSVWDGIKPVLTSEATDSALTKLAKTAGRGATDLPFVSDALSVASYGIDVNKDLSRGSATAPYLVMDAAKDFGTPVVAQMASNGVKAFIQSAATAATETTATAGADALAAAGTDAALAGGADVVAGAAAAGAVPVLLAGGAAFAVGYEVSNFISGGEKDWANAVTKGGGAMVDGISSGNWGEVGSGAETMAKDVGKGFVDGGKHALNQTVSDVVSVANLAKNAATSAWNTVSSWF